MLLKICHRTETSHSTHAYTSHHRLCFKLVIFSRWFNNPQDVTNSTLALRELGWDLIFLLAHLKPVPCYFLDLVAFFSSLTLTIPYCYVRTWNTVVKWPALQQIHWVILGILFFSVLQLHLGKTRIEKLILPMQGCIKSYRCSHPGMTGEKIGLVLELSIKEKVVIVLKCRLQST